AKVPTVITLTESENETTAFSKYILPINNQFESWGDYQPRNGIFSLQQPVIHPLYDTRQKEAVLLSLSQNGQYSEELYHNFLRENWQSDVFPQSGRNGDFRKFWFGALHDGVVVNQAEYNQAGS